VKSVLPTGTQARSSLTDVPVSKKKMRTPSKKEGLREGELTRSLRIVEERIIINIKEIYIH
jgi:hypothetical protein